MRELSKRTRRERRILRDIIDTFNGTILFQWRPPLPALPKQRVIMQSRIDDRVYGCGGDVVPYWARPSLDRPGRVAVVHAVPSKSDHAAGTMGNGVSAHRVRSGLAAGGIAASMVTEIATVPMFLDRMPTVDEMATHHNLLLDAIDAADVDYVLLHGSHALHCWRPDLTLAQMAGKVGLWRSRWWVSAIYHAESAYQGHGMLTREEWMGSIVRFTDLVNAPDPFKMVHERCIARTKSGLCEAGAYAWDEDALPWCDEHFDKGRQGHLDAAKGPKQSKQLPGQLSLEL